MTSIVQKVYVVFLKVNKTKFKGKSFLVLLTREATFLSGLLGYEQFLLSSQDNVHWNIWLPHRFFLWFNFSSKLYVDLVPLLKKKLKAIKHLLQINITTICISAAYRLSLQWSISLTEKKNVFLLCSRSCLTPL